MLRFGVHKPLNAQNAKTVFNRGDGIAKLLGKLALADRNALVIVGSGYVPQDLFFEKGLTRGVYSSRDNFAFLFHSEGCFALAIKYWNCKKKKSKGGGTYQVTRAK